MIAGMTPPKRRKPGISDYFRREWPWHGAVGLGWIVLTWLAGGLEPLWLAR